MARKSPMCAVIAAILIMSTPIITAFAPPIRTNTRCSVAMRARLPKFLRRWFDQEDTNDTETPVISVGTELPDLEVDTVLATTGQGELLIVPIAIKETMGQGLSVLVCMPAASIKSCASIHVPGYKDAISSLLELGVKRIVISLTSDKFLNQERTEDTYILTTSEVKIVGDKQHVERTALEQTDSTPVRILIDEESILITKLGITKEMGFGVRTNRLVVIFEDGIVKQVLREEGVKDCTATSATRLVEFLRPEEPPVGENPEGIEIDFRLIIAIGAILTIAFYEGLAAFFVEQGWSIPFLPGFQKGQPTPVEEAFQLLKDYL